MKVTRSEFGHELVNFGAYSADNLRAQFSYDDTFPINSDRYGMMTWWVSQYIGDDRSWFINSSNELVLVIPQKSSKNWAVA